MAVDLQQIHELLTDEFVCEVASTNYKDVRFKSVILGRGTREAAHDLLDYASPSRIRNEVDMLRSAGERSDVELAKRTLQTMSTETKRLLQHRAATISGGPIDYETGSQSGLRIGRHSRLQVHLPTIQELDDPEKRDTAFAAFRCLTTYGGIKLRRWKPYLYAPTVGRGREPRVEARQFVADMRITFLLAHPDRVPPAMTANHNDKGPFARLLKGILDRIQAGHIDVVEAILADAKQRKDFVRKRDSA